ncbi:MAG: VapC toxin family PIN domain ribonuclease [Chloroflexi bacterium]|nr:VapC toxin family PIN domain ribonuclease [Chloroflexota bacterium]
MAILIDTNFLVAVASKRDVNHEAARAALRGLLGRRVIPNAVLPEIFYMLKEREYYLTAVQMFNRLYSGAFQLENLVNEDFRRMEEIMLQYADHQFDFVDTAIMALSERLKITQVYTFDRRDFTIFRPKHSDYLELLP